MYGPKTVSKEQSFFEDNIEDEHFIPNPEKSDKSFFEKVKICFLNFYKV
jgi:molecular chaperone DnaJ